MQKPEISPKQGILLMVLFIEGTSFLMVMGLAAGRDIWLAYLIALAVSMVFALMYARILSHGPGKDFFETLESMTGKVWSRVILIPMAVYLLQFLTNVLKHFSQFIDSAGIPSAPPIVPYLGMGLLAVLAVYYGIEILGKWSEIFVYIVIAFSVISGLLLTRNMDFQHLLPLMREGVQPIGKGALQVISFPLCQVAAFLFVLPAFKDKKAPYKVFSWGLLIGFVLIFIVALGDILVLGINQMERLYYPSFTTLSIVKVGQFIQRLEIVAATVFTLAVFVKAGIILIALCRVIGYILGLEEHRFLAAPVALLSINYGYIAYGSAMEFREWIRNFWPFFSSVFQLLIPLLIFIIFEFQAAKRKRKIGIGTNQ